MKILVVDDDSLAGEMTGAVLEDAGHHVETTENAMDAIEALNRGGFDMVVSDMNMPLIDGIELFQTLREQGVDVPFILLSGDDPAPLLAREPRLDGCLIKDFSLDVSLIAAVQTAAARRG